MLDTGEMNENKQDTVSALKNYRGMKDADTF